MRKPTPEEEDFAIQEERHRELRQLLGSLKDNGNKEISDALNQHTTSIKNLANSIYNLPKPEVNVNTNIEPFIAAVKSLENKIDDLIKENKNLVEVISLPKESKIAFNRTYGGYLESPITVTTSIKKIKAQA